MSYKKRENTKIFTKDFVLELIVFSILAYIVGYIGRDSTYDIPKLYKPLVIISVGKIMIHLMRKRLKIL